jgi:hypothetical protein
MRTPKRTAPRTYVTPVVYRVPEDLSAERYQEIVEAIADWFAKSRNSKEPVLLAKQYVGCALAGTTTKGQPWFTAATMPLDRRIRVLCRYDILKMEPIESASERHYRATEIRLKTDLKKKQDGRKAKKPENDRLLPDELRKELQARATYGDDPKIMFTQLEEKQWRELKKAYMAEFPHLSTVNAQAELEQLCDLHVLQSRVRMSRNSGRPSPIDASTIVDELQKLKKALGIHPDQLKNRVEKNTEVTIGAAALRLQQLGDDWRYVRAKYQLEEFLQAFQMFHTPSADGTGYQLNEAELFALTRCRTCECAACGQRNMAGWRAEEIEQVLRDRGILAELPDAGNPEPTEAL